MPDPAPTPLRPAAADAALPPPSPVTATGGVYAVKPIDTVLRVRSSPVLTVPVNRNVVARLNPGHLVHAVGETVQNGFLKIETSVNGALIRGYVAREMVQPAEAGARVEVVQPAAVPPAGTPPAVRLPTGNGGARRTEGANALSLKEAGQPVRTAGTTQQVVGQMNAIIDWLDSEKQAHARYWPAHGKTYCNVYAHDFCTLAGAYLPRVWWTEPALMRLARGEQVAPVYGVSLREMRANDLCRWFKDWGLAFGWRQTGSLTKLQEAANAGVIGVIVARRVEESRSGHITIIAPETGSHRAKRKPSGEVELPLQSQAGTVNLRRSTLGKAWWRGSQFADFGYWIHG